MIQVSSRHALTIAVLVGLALLPGFVHRGGRFLHDDCRSPGALLEHPWSDLSAAVPAPEALRDLPLTRFAARRLALPEGQANLDLYVVQSFNTGMVYRPALFFVEKRNQGTRKLEPLEHDGQLLPVYRTYFERPVPRGKVTVAGHLLIFDSNPVAHPYLAELKALPSQLFLGRKPAWVFFARTEVAPRSREMAESFLRETLASAWDEYRAACLP